MSDDKETKEAVLGCAGAIVLLAITPVTIVINGFLMRLFWSWFVVPHFGAAPLSVPVAIGLMMIAMFAVHHPSSIKGQKIDIATTIIGAFMRPLLYLLEAWIVHQFV